MQFSFIFDMDGLILDTETIARKVWPIVYNFISEQEADDDYLHVVCRIALHRVVDSRRESAVLPPICRLTIRMNRLLVRVCFVRIGRQDTSSHETGHPDSNKPS